MFSIEHKTENGFNIVLLRDENTGCFAEIVPECGAGLKAFGMISDARNFQVIDYYQSKAEFDQSVEPLGYKSCKLSPFVCRLRDGRYRFGAEDYQIQMPEEQQHALHGLLYKKRFEVANEEANELQAAITLKYSYRGDNEGYPFNYDCLITYRLAGDCKLHLRTECINRSEGLIPVQDGWHPYFNLGEKIDNLELEFQSLEQYVFDKDLLPTGNKTEFKEFSSIMPIGDIHLDNSFTLDMQECQPLCVLRNKSDGIEVQIFPSKSYPILQVYTPDHRNSIALENLSGPPDAFNLGKGFITLESGQSAIFETAYRINFI